MWGKMWIFKEKQNNIIYIFITNNIYIYIIFSWAGLGAQKKRAQAPAEFYSVTAQRSALQLVPTLLLHYTP